MIEGRASARKALWIAVFLAALAGSFIVLNPLRVVLPAAGLDPSWVAVLGEASSRGLSHGEDVIYSAGPLSSIFTGYLDETLFWIKLGLHGFLVLVLAWLVVALAQPSQRPVAALLFALSLAILATSLGGRGAILIALPMLTALLATARCEMRASSILVGTAATAISTLAKFSVAPLAVVSFVIADAVQLCRRRMPVFLLSFTAMLFALFCLVDRPASFIPFVVNSASVVSGYSDAMSLPVRKAIDPVGIASLALLLLVVIGWTEIAAVRAGSAGWPSAAGRWLLIGAYLLLAFKAGLVRHDDHVFTSWASLVVAYMTYALVAPRRDVEGTAGAFGASALCAVLGYVILLAVIPYFLHERAKQPLLAQLASITQQRFAEAKQFAAWPSAWLEKRLGRKRAAWKRIADEHPLPRLDGSVDIIPSLQSTVLANGLDYRPRPSFQDFATYTTRLIELNRHYLLNRGPDYLLFRPSMLDGRHPALTEGPLWPEILRLYDPSAFTGDLLILRRRAQPLAESVLGPAESIATKFRETAALPDSETPFLATVRIRKSWFGQLAALFYRAPRVFVEVIHCGGRTERYRIIPAIAEAGFLLSPTVTTAQDFLQVAAGNSAELIPPVTAIKFTAGPLQAWFYRPEIELTVRPVLAELFASRPLSDELRRALAAKATLYRLWQSVPQTAKVSFVPEGLQIHPPVLVSLVLDRDATGLELRYGIRDPVWEEKQGGDGACFSLAVDRGGEASTLFERCLHPQQEPEDRGEQTARLETQVQAGDKITLKTSCRAHCDYDWAYVSALQFDAD